MKTFWTIILIAVLVLVGVWLFKTGDTPTDEQHIVEGVSEYRDPDGVFSFKYPSAFAVTGRGGSTVAKVDVDRSYEPGTNFSGAVLTINWASGGTDATCSGETHSSEAAAGNRYDTTIYKKLFDGDCYTFTRVIHSTNIGNYDPNQGVREFDRERIEKDLDNVVQSFTYLLNSD